jgi:predicted ATPase/class 3 adenylate cyclase
MDARTRPPSGTITFLFSDIEGSTQRWERDRAAMEAAVRRHDELMRSAIRTRDGYVFKTIGDAFCAAFARPEDAVGAALDAQRSLGAEDFSAVDGVRVRMALHTGTADERDGDYFGPAVNRVARLLSAGNGGQVLLSGVTSEIVGSALRDGVTLRDLGEHRLKDLARPERVAQLAGPGLDDAFPPLRSVGSFPNNLPHQLARFLGRESEVAELARLMKEHRLVTIVGSGGIGKTRTALQVAANLLDGSTDGVWFVEFAALRDPELVAATLARVLGVREAGGQPIRAALVEFLEHRELLLVLDNCEHLLDEVAPLLDEILRSCAGVVALATSREGLGIPGERTYPLPPLPVPQPDTDTEFRADQAIAFDSVMLFVDRAQTADARFVLTDHDAPIVAEICRRLDGIPLALELAAARVKVLSIEGLARRLDERFRFLTGGSRTALPRQQTMRALIEWSYDLLAEDERTLFARLAVFAGGWTLEAAEAVSAGDRIDPLDVLDLTSSLVEKSLVGVDLASGSARYRFFESTRAFAREKLEERGERHDLARRHAQWVAGVADLADETWWTTPQQWYALFAPELENARAALDFAGANGDSATIARIAGGLCGVWHRIGSFSELERWLLSALPSLPGDADGALTARAWRALALARIGADRVDAAQRALTLYEASGDTFHAAVCLSFMATGFRQEGRYADAVAANDRALGMLAELGMTRSAAFAMALDYRGQFMSERGAWDEARRLHGQALEVAVALGDENYAYTIRQNLAEVEYAAGDPQRALELLEESAATGVEFLGGRAVAITNVNVAAYRIATGDVVGARAAARAALARARRERHRILATIALQHLATVEALSGDARRAARLLGYVDAAYLRDGLAREGTERLAYGTLTAALRKRLSQADIDALAADGAQLGESEAIALATGTAGSQPTAAG